MSSIMFWHHILNLLLIDDIQKLPSSKLKRVQVDFNSIHVMMNQSMKIYLDFQFLDDAFWKTINNGIKSLDARRHIQISSDEP